MKRNSHLAVLMVQIVVALLTLTGVVFAGGLLNTEATTGGSPTAVSYQGKVSISGAPFSGTGYFKFALVDSAGTTSFWSNDGSSTGGSQPASAVALTVSKGLFTVLLGDTSLAHMTRPLTAAAFRSPNRALRVWFSSDNVAFTLLSPDTRLASVPYALQAEEAHNADYSYYPLLQAQSLNMATPNANLAGFSGGFTDGRYGYFVPFQNCSGSGSSTIGRVDLQNFTTSGVNWLNLSAVDASLSCFLGGFTDGRYGYLVPFPHGKIVRIDLQNFTTGGVSWLDLSLVNSGLQGFSGGFTDGRYGYFAPNWSSSYHGKIVRVDLQNFTTGGVSWLDLATVNSGLVGFAGGFTDGRFGYFVPDFNGTNRHGKIVRLDLQNFTTGGVSWIDLGAVDSNLAGFTGGFTDGRYAYLAPSNNSTQGKIARVDLQNFTSSGVSVLDLTTVEASLKGFTGAFTDGRFGYFVPYTNGKIARIDLQDFATSGVSWLDLASLDNSLVGFFGGFTDGRYGYLAPFAANGSYSGNVARIQLFSGTTGP